MRWFHNASLSIHRATSLNSHDHDSSHCTWRLEVYQMGWFRNAIWPMHRPGLIWRSEIQSPPMQGRRGRRHAPHEYYLILNCRGRSHDARSGVQNAQSWVIFSKNFTSNSGYEPQTSLANGVPTSGWCPSQTISWRYDKSKDHRDLCRKPIRHLA